MNIVCAVCAPTPPYAPVVWVVEGLSLDNKKRACEPPASQTMKRGKGNRSVIKSYSGQYNVRLNSYKSEGLL